jgi:maltoporin
VSALKAQIQSLQKQQQSYQDRITSMETEMKALESKADSGTILNTRVLADANGTEINGNAPALDESFLKSLTRNFTFSAYVRAGFEVNGNGGGGNFNFAIPDNFEAGRMRLGNENDTYFELTWMQAHMLGDSPDVMDVSMTFTPAIRYQQSRSTFQGFPGGGLSNSGLDGQFIMRQAYLNISNVFKSAPEVTFWAGQRFYDRWNTDPEDYFWLDTSGYGAGVNNIDVGIGKLWFAWLDGLNGNFYGPTIGSENKQTFDIRLKDIDVGVGHLMAVLIADWDRNGTYDQTYNAGGSIVNLTNPLRVDSAWGIGGGLVYTVNFGPGGSNNQLTAYVLFGRGATDFSASDDLSYNGYWLSGAENYYLLKHPNLAPGQTMNLGDPIDRQKTFRAGFQAYIALPWYHSEPAAVAGSSKDGKGIAALGPAPAPRLPWFSLGIYGDWQHSDAGTFLAEIPNGNQAFSVGIPNNGQTKMISGVTNDLQGGIRPAVWFAPNIALEGQAGIQYESNNRVTPGLNGFGQSGTMGIFTISPVIKPQGGYFTRPELRVFATYALWTHSLANVISPIQENGTNSNFVPPFNSASSKDHGFLFGTQVEWFF